jgi:hypothetical protein
MALTRAQKRLYDQAKEIAGLAMVDIWEVEQWDSEARLPLLRIAIAHMVVAEVVTRYTLFDQVLSDLILKYFYKSKSKNQFLFWRRKKFLRFVHYILDEMFLLKKMELVNAIRPLPSEVRSTLHKVNMIRNAMAHSFFPENRKEYKKVGKVLYDGKDIRTPEGLQAFKDDCHTAWVYLATRAFGKWRE